MKFLKKLFYGIAIFIMLCCAGMLIVAFSPGMSDSLSQILYGEDGLKIPIKSKPIGGNADSADGSAVGGSTADGSAADGSVADGGTGNGVGSEGIWGDTTSVATGVLASENGGGYVAPLRGSLNLPDQVIGKSGYEPVSASVEELGEDQADELGTQIGIGETGDGLSFDALMYPYYHMLNSQMQHIYRQIYANALVLKSSFTPVEEINTSQLKNVFEAVYNDHPELFWLETSYSCKYRPDGKCVEVVLSYNRTAQNLEQSKAEFEKQARGIVDGAGQGDVRSQEKYVHDALLKKADYSASAPMNQSAYSALVNGDTVCAGYSRAFQYMMQQLGVPCYYCTGYSGEDHAWNIIQLDDGFYNVDATWDDTNPSTYDYFNKSDAEFVGTHVRTGLSVYLPPCGAGADLGDGSVVVGSNKPGGITLNPNPQQPLTWVPKEKPQQSGTNGSGGNSVSSTATVSGNDIYDLDKAGISADKVIDTMNAYYADCLKQMEKVGSGNKSFDCIVPKSVLSLVEQSYGTGEYFKKYVEEGLKRLQKEHFSIQLQVEDLGGNYYRVRHNIATW